MSAESLSLPLPPLPQHEFAYRLEGFHADPHGSVLEMETSLDIEIGKWLGFRRGRVREQPEVFRTEYLSPERYEAIKSFEEMIHLFSAYGTAPPEQIGLWLEAPNADLHNKSPMVLLF